MRFGTILNVKFELQITIFLWCGIVNQLSEHKEVIEKVKLKDAVA